MDGRHAVVKSCYDCASVRAWESSCCVHGYNCAVPEVRIGAVG